MILVFVNVHILNTVVMLDENNQFCAYELTACHTNSSGARMVFVTILAKKF